MKFKKQKTILADFAKDYYSKHKSIIDKAADTFKKANPQAKGMKSYEIFEGILTGYRNQFTKSKGMANELAKLTIAEMQNKDLKLYTALRAADNRKYYGLDDLRKFNNKSFGPINYTNVDMGNDQTVFEYYNVPNPMGLVLAHIRDESQDSPIEYWSYIKEDII